MTRGDASQQTQHGRTCAGVGPIRPRLHLDLDGGLEGVGHAAAAKEHVVVLEGACGAYAAGSRQELLLRRERIAGGGRT